MAKKMVIATHGTLAKGFQDALNLLAGNAEQITVIDAFTVDKNPKQTVEKLMGDSGEDDEFFVFTDVMAGSVNQLFVPYIGQKKLHLVTGINLALLCQAFLTLDQLTEEGLREAVSQAQSQILYVNDELAKKQKANGTTDTFFS